jgi:sulfur-carrier protein
MALVKVRIPTPLRTFTAGQDAVAVEGSTVGEVIDALEGAHPGLKDKLCDDSGRVRRFVNIFANDEDIRFLEDLATPVDDGDEVSIVPAIAGGREA